MPKPFTLGFTGFSRPRYHGDRIPGVLAAHQSEPPVSCPGTENGVHCFQSTGLVLQSYPQQYPEQCRHCSMTRRLVRVENVYAYEG